MAIREDNFLYTITSIRQKLFKLLRRELTEHGIADIAPSYGDILFVLDRKGAVTPQELARHTIKDKSTVSSVINKLEAGGYIAKAKDNRDGRSINLTLTPKAAQLRPELLAISKKMNARLFTGFSEEDKQTLFRLLEKVYRNL